MIEIEIFGFFYLNRNSVGADVAKWIKAVDCESTMRGFNSRRSPIHNYLLNINQIANS